MLEEKLAEASKAAARQRQVMGMVIIACLALAGLALIGMNYIDFSKSAVEAEAPMTLAKPATLPAPPVTSAPAQTVPASSEEDSTVLRERYKAGLKVYEQSVEPLLAEAALANWAPELDLGIKQNKDASLQEFATGNYGPALDHLAKAAQLAEQALARWNSEFAEAYAAAQQFFDQQSGDKAKLKIEEALALKPMDANALALAERIATLGDVQGLLKTADVARIENNPQKELDALEAVLELDPARSDLKNRVQELQTELAETRFANLISSGLTSVDQRNLRKARDAYDKAKQIYSNRKELGVLAAKIEALRLETLLETALAETKTLIGKDDWQGVLTKAQEGLKSHPTHQVLLERAGLAKDILATSAKVTDFINRADRLSSSNVFNEAKQTLRAGEALEAMSFSLTRKLDQLGDLLKAYSIDHDVFVVSDNQTEILVRGVGVVGKTAGRAIKLRPGAYVFEGKRAGFKAKLVNVTVPVTPGPVQVEVICNEPI